MNKIVLAHIAAIIASLSAGAAVVATRFVIGETDPLSLAFYRYVIGILCLAPIVPFIWPKHRIALSEFGKIALLGVLFFGFFPWAFNASLQYIPAARGAVGLATIPIQTLIVAALFGREKLTVNKVLGVAVAFAGIAAVFGPEAIKLTNSNYFVGDTLMLLGAFSAALYSVFSRETLTRHGPLLVTALAMAFAVIALFPLAVFQSGMTGIPTFSPQGWWAVIFLGTFAGAVQFSLFTWALRWLPPTTTVLYLTLNPIAAMLLGVVLIGETISTVLIAGLVLVLGGILVANGVVAKVWAKRGLANAPTDS